MFKSFRPLTKATPPLLWLHSIKIPLSLKMIHCMPGGRFFFGIGRLAAKIALCFHHQFWMDHVCGEL